MGAESGFAGLRFWEGAGGGIREGGTGGGRREEGAGEGELGGLLKLLSDNDSLSKVAGTWILGLLRGMIRPNKLVRK